MRTSYNLLLVGLAFVLIVCFDVVESGQARAQSAAVQRPPIVGVAHIALHVSDMKQAEEFFGHDLGYAHFSPAKGADGTQPNYYKVNDHQYIQVSEGLDSPTADRLAHIAFETTDARRLRDYLASKGIEVPASVKPDPEKNLSFGIKDPDGHEVRFVQYMRGSVEQSRFGKMLPDTRLSDHMIHVGFTVQDREAEDRLFKDVLGFKIMWHGGMKDDVTSWVDMRVPEGSDWLEYMLNVHNPTPKTLGVMNHLALGVKEIQPPYKTILERGYKPDQPPKIGRDGKWQLNLYDADLTRVELMEFKPVQAPCCSPFTE